MLITVDAPVKDTEAEYVDEGNTAWAVLVTIVNQRSNPIHYSLTARTGSPPGLSNRDGQELKNRLHHGFDVLVLGVDGDVAP